MNRCENLVDKITQVLNTLLNNSQSLCSDCEKCQLKYEGSCPVHGALIYIDNAEVNKYIYVRTNQL
uniref:Uncharacterized protein n=1 Tax=Arion vulgaris TaxID=1028688 RepID=A0A0B7B9P0_9EUPU